MLTVYLDIIKVFYSPTDAQVNCLKNNLKFCIKINIKTAPKCFGAITPSSGSALFVLAKVTVVKIANQNTTVCGDVREHITTHRCILIGYFNNCNLSKDE